MCGAQASSRPFTRISSSLCLVGPIVTICFSSAATKRDTTDRLFKFSIHSHLAISTVRSWKYFAPSLCHCSIKCSQSVTIFFPDCQSWTWWESELRRVAKRFDSFHAVFWLACSLNVKINHGLVSIPNCYVSLWNISYTYIMQYACVDFNCNAIFAKYQMRVLLSVGAVSNRINIFNSLLSNNNQFYWNWICARISSTLNPTPHPPPCTSAVWIFHNSMVFALQCKTQFNERSVLYVWSNVPCSLPCSCKQFCWHLVIRKRRQSNVSFLFDAKFVAVSVFTIFPTKLTKETNANRKY